jgi:hypothetical protein
LRLVGPPLLALDYVGLYAAPTYDFKKAYRQHESLLTALNSGTGEDARKVFEETLEVFRLQDMENLRALKSAKNGPPRDSPRQVSAKRPKFRAKVMPLR